MRKRILGAVAAMAMGLGALTLATAPTANAAVRTWTCDGTGNIYITPGAGNTEYINFSGTARCVRGGHEGPYVASFTGTGGMGGPACNGGLPLAYGLTLQVTMDAQ